MEEEILLWFLIYFSIWITVVLISIQVLWIFSLINCIKKEKDRVKQQFWILVILGLGSIGLFIYLLHRVPTRKRELKEPGFNSEIEERIMRKISRKRPPRKDLIFKPAWPRLPLNIAFTLLIILFIMIYSIGMPVMVYNMSLDTGVGADSNSDPLFLVGFAIPLLMLILILMLMNPRTGWNRILVSGTSEQELNEHLGKAGFVGTDHGHYLPVEDNFGLIIRYYRLDRKIMEYLKKRNIDHGSNESLILLVSVGNPRWGSPLRLLHPDTILKRGPVYRITGRFNEVMKNIDGIEMVDLTFKKVKKI